MKELVNIQSELKAPKNQYNSFGKYKYRSCEDVLEALKPLLKKYYCTLVITDEVKESGGIVYVEATVSISNEDMSVSRTVSAQAGINPNKKGMDIAQSFGSSSSYARKYALNGLFLIDDTKDADTEANKKGMDIAQSFGSSSSYARKYALNGLFLIDDTKDADTEAPAPGKKKFTATDAQAEKLKGTEGKDLKAKYIITDAQIEKYNNLK